MLHAHYTQTQMIFLDICYDVVLSSYSQHKLCKVSPQDFHSYQLSQQQKTTHNVGSKQIQQQTCHKFNKMLNKPLWYLRLPDDNRWMGAGKDQGRQLAMWDVEPNQRYSTGEGHRYEAYV